ncbi:LYR motif-containing protein 4A [Takifugu flavidus]|uniref:LYR motif-containing protein 4A n=1 Tax=Takifugu flavidus TaxID=433684 RepID=A0A5C6NSY5_9TELE|nr:LYR motif-containing protein 4A [Takifugu flavidus]
MQGQENLQDERANGTTEATSTLWSHIFRVLQADPVMSINMSASTRSQVISLYKLLLTESKKFPSYNYRNYAVRRVRDAFRANRTIGDPTTVERLITEGQQTLALIQRQSELAPADGSRQASCGVVDTAMDRKTGLDPSEMAQDGSSGVGSGPADSQGPNRDNSVSVGCSYSPGPPCTGRPRAGLPACTAAELIGSENCPLPHPSATNQESASTFVRVHVRGAEEYVSIGRMFASQKTVVG